MPRQDALPRGRNGESHFPEMVSMLKQLATLVPGQEGGVVPFGLNTPLEEFTPPLSTQHGGNTTTVAKTPPNPPLTPEQRAWIETRYHQGDGIWEIGEKAASNLWPSAQQVGSDILRTVFEPKETFNAIGNVAQGVLELFVPGEQEHERYANALGQFVVDRYGGVENIKRTITEDPVGFLTDLATVLSLGSFGLARVPGLAGQIGRVAGSVGRTIDPINNSLKVLKQVKAKLPTEPVRYGYYARQAEDKEAGEEREFLGF